MCRVDSQLVRAASDWLELDPGDSIDSLDHFPNGGAHFPVFSIVNLVRSIVDIEPEREFDRTFVFFDYAV